MMRKFALILLRDIMNNRNSLVRREFMPYMKDGAEAKTLTAAIAYGLSYPTMVDGTFDYDQVVVFLENHFRTRLNDLGVPLKKESIPNHRIMTPKKLRLRLFEQKICISTKVICVQYALQPACINPRTRSKLNRRVQNATHDSKRRLLK